MTPFAVLSLLRHGNDSSASPSDPLQYLNTPAARIITGVLAAGEIFGDKLPMIPSRLSAWSIGGPYRHWCT